MSNLGMYQTITTISKKVHGPQNFIGLVALIGYGIGRTSEFLIKRTIVVAHNRKKQKKAANSKIFTINKDGKSNEGLQLSKGERFRILERDGDAALIERIGDKNSPYFVSAKLLHKISDYNE